MGKMTHGAVSPKKQQEISATPAQGAFQRNFSRYLTLLSGGTEQDLNRQSLSRHTGTRLSNCFFIGYSSNLSLSVLQIWQWLWDFSKILFSPFILAFLRLFPVGLKTPAWLTGTDLFKEQAAQALYPYCITSKTV
ncbi:MAG TPA: hypothetical protein VL053_17270 [Arachidicoccus sp.]|nr:hypothetical protein [Arachidicoccus sp.]